MEFTKKEAEESKYGQKDVKEESEEEKERFKSENS